MASSVSQYQSRARARRPKVLRSVQPNAGTEAAYTRKLLELLDEMHTSVVYWLETAEEPALAADATRPRTLREIFEDLAKRWEAKFDEAAPALADWFSREADGRSEYALYRILKNGGFSVKFKSTKAMNQVLRATISEQVGLIKSIPQSYLGKVRGAVMRSIQTGRNLKQLVDDIQDIYAVSKSKAKLIALDQNNKATSAMVHARQRSLGITEAIWMHSHAGVQPRPAHVKMNGKKYKIDRGMWDPVEKRYVFPGELIRCRCTSRPVIPGLE